MAQTKKQSIHGLNVRSRDSSLNTIYYGAVTSFWYFTIPCRKLEKNWMSHRWVVDVKTEDKKPVYRLLCEMRPGQATDWDNNAKQSSCHSYTDWCVQNAVIEEILTLYRSTRCTDKGLLDAVATIKAYNS